MGRRQAARVPYLAGFVALAAAVVGFTGSASASPRPFGHACKPRDGVRFCPTVDSAHRVRTFDGVPLDADVTLPPTGKGPFPAIVMMHGWGQDKTAYEFTSPAAGYSNEYFAKQGYAVLTYSARGWGNSCGGGPARRQTGACGKGYIHLDDSRYEARDTQHLLGLLADQGIVKPKRIGVTGQSYGGGQSSELAMLKDKILKPDGKLYAWRSPRGKPMAIRAAYARYGFSDLLDALVPNGRFLDTGVAPFKQSLNPMGVPKQTVDKGLYMVGKLFGYYCGDAPASTPCTDGDANVTQWNRYIEAGLPLPVGGLASFTRGYLYHGSYPIGFLPNHSRPAPLLILNGWTDDVFPPAHALRTYNFLRSRYGKRFPVSLQFSDSGHQRGANKAATNRYFTEQAVRFFAHHLKGKRGNSPAPGAVTTFTQTCPKTVPDGGPYTAASWSALQTGRFTFGDTSTKTFTSDGGDATVGPLLDPVAVGNDSCRTLPRTNEANVATYQRTVTDSFTMLGLPTITADVTASGQFGQIAARLWDVSPADDTQLLITRGVYSLTTNQSGKITFQLHGNGYRFEAGHVVELELLGRDVPYYRAGNFPVSIDVSNLAVSLPTR